MLGNDLLIGKDEDWNILGVKDKTLEVVLRDRLMTDAALGGTRPIKTEHSYSLLAYSPPASPATTNCRSPSPATVNVASSKREIDIEGRIRIATKIDDMEEECFPAISMKKASSHGRTSPTDSSPITPSNILDVVEECMEIKEEPLHLIDNNNDDVEINIDIDDKNLIEMISPNRLHLDGQVQQQQQQHNHNHHQQQEQQQQHTSDSEADDEDYEDMNLGEYHVSSQLISSSNSCCNDDTQTSSQSLPPTPPSSNNSDSESGSNGGVSASCSPIRRLDNNNICTVQNIRGIYGPRLYVTNGHTTRQPIHTSLISCQPKGSTGTLILTEEEKRTLIAEGYPVPTKLPLTKQEEKSLKKVRRKIKNKISAQESRRKKKEYMDGLERKVSILSNENLNYRNRVSTLEQTNRELMKELEHLQALVARQKS
ncbi:cyclic AMP response element-binding protein A isoform X2 [Microplitis mediator]|nr:cyclic AMP response element-binding protein A isoform X2 [Microplitis mediator]XP_057341207.1 cyclic AMP response element-binding protein A isoform X2 [Microplitis mediator]